MLSVQAALERILETAHPLPAELVALPDALGRVLAEPVTSRRTQPPMAVSAMDGWAVRAADIASVPTVLRQIGTVPAGGRFDGCVEAGTCVRIFTGAPLPEGADAILIQENASAAADAVTALESVPPGRHVRPAGLDFQAGEPGLPAGRALRARDIGLAAAMNVPWLMVHRRPRVAILSTGDEIVLPGDPVGPNQIVSANGPALAALVTACGGVPIHLGIAPDEAGALRRMAEGARGADLLVTSGGASVGDHDLVRDVLGEGGLAIDFWKIAMRPGKPLMFGRAGGVPLLGLPGNPVSAYVCALLFLRPLLLAMQGLAVGDETVAARLGAPLPANDQRQDYLRAEVSLDGDGVPVATPFAKQDSSMMTLLARSDGLIVRDPHAPAVSAGATVRLLRFPAGGPAL
ncbi:MAG TPA: gephyrin-like molybdotransferase Glp [Azospirillaceae bacterium]|nr:gephyrin-like molybdotransferase Glp [Azospirillaceae bacterium]